MKRYNIPKAHKEHWMEPVELTAERLAEDIYCEFCGEEVPWHKVSCSMLKNAYKRRKGTCSFCSEEYIVGDAMLKHTTEKHQADLKRVFDAVIPKKAKKK